MNNPSSSSQGKPRRFYQCQTVGSSGLSTILGSGRIKPDAMAEAINRQAAGGWVLQTVTPNHARMLLIFRRPVFILTFYKDTN